jgi:predicted bacteriocin transport accessory protein
MKGMNKKSILAGCALMLVGCSQPKLSIEQNSTLQSYQEITIDELEELFDRKDDFYVVKSLSTCTYCNQLKPVMSEVVADLSIPLYVITVYSIAEEGHPETSFADYQRIADLLTGSSYPTMYVVDDGEVVSYGAVGGYSVEQLTTTIERYLG